MFCCEQKCIYVIDDTHIIAFVQLLELSLKNNKDDRFVVEIVAFNISSQGNSNLKFE